MATQAKVVSFQITTGAVNTVIQVRGVGFQPKVVIPFWCGRDNATDASGRASHTRGLGFATGTSNRACINGQSTDAVATSQCDQDISASSLIATMLNQAAGGVNGRADFNGVDPDGFDVIIDDQFSASFRVFCLCLGGDSITNQTVGSFLEATATGNFDAVTTAGFTPTFAMVLSNGVTTAEGQLTHSAIAIGAAASAASQIVMSAGGRDNLGTTTCEHYATDSTEVTGRTASGSVNDRCAFVDFSPTSGTGFRLNKLNSANAIFCGYLAMAGASVAVGSFVTKTDTTSIPITGLGFKPAGVLLLSCCAAENTPGTLTADDFWSVGAFTSSSNQMNMAVMDANGKVAGTVVATAIDYNACYTRLDTTGAVVGVMVADSMDTDGFTVHMSDADPDAAWVGYVAFGPFSDPVRPMFRGTA